jgi:predicted ester cyclase
MTLPRRHCFLALAGLAAASAQAADACMDDDARRRRHAALLDRYVAAINALDLAAFPDIFTEAYVQHSGRSPSGLAAQVENARRLHEAWPDLRMRVDDRVLGDDKVVARCTYTGTHTKTIRGFAPTGRVVSFGTIDIWRVEDGKFAEHWDLVDIAGMERQLAGT